MIIFSWKKFIFYSCTFFLKLKSLLLLNSLKAFSFGRDTRICSRYIFISSGGIISIDVVVIFGLLSILISVLPIYFLKTDTRMCNSNRCGILFFVSHKVSNIVSDKLLYLKNESIAVKIGLSDNIEKTLNLEHHAKYIQDKDGLINVDKEPSAKIKTDTHICDDDSDCSVYGNSKPYCIGGVCKSCASSGEEVSSGTKCCSGLYRTSSGTCGSCGVYSYDKNRNCYVRCASGNIYCTKGYYCKDYRCVSSCGMTSNGFPISHLSNGICCNGIHPAVEKDICYECTDKNQYACKKGEICNRNTCEEVCTKGELCCSTKKIVNFDWIKNNERCSGCGKGQVQARGLDISENSSCSYPHIGKTKCYDIPLPGSNVYWGDRGAVGHKITSITYAGMKEEWHLIGPYVNWWEAVELCGRLGLFLPTSRETLIGADGSLDSVGKTRWLLLKNAFDINTSTYVWTEEDYGNYCYTYSVTLSSGIRPYYPRDYIADHFYALCGPKT